MSVYKRQGATTWSYDFLLEGVRFSGGTGQAERRAAEAHVRDIARPAARAEVARRKAQAAAEKGEAPITAEHAFALWYAEAGQHLAAPATVLKDLDRLLTRMGRTTHLADIDDRMLTRLVAQRRGDWRWDKPPSKANPQAQRVAPATVNRSVTKRLQDICSHARQKWKLPLPREPDWRIHLLAEPVPTPRAIPQTDLDRLLHALPEGYRELAAFAQATGLRLAECFITWDDVAWEAGVIHVVQKGGRPRRVVISRRVAAILGALRGQDATHVFTYEAARRGGKAGHRILGQRYPVTYAGMKSAFGRAAERLGLDGVTFHKQRHTRAISYLRATKDLKGTQRLLGHARISTTADYYVDVLDDDIRTGLDTADAAQTPTPIPTPARTGTAND
jgi:integrase